MATESPHPPPPGGQDRHQHQALSHQPEDDTESRVFVVACLVVAVLEACIAHAQEGNIWR
jgi:hypothetical protein